MKHAIDILYAQLSTLEHNQPIHAAEGDSEQAALVGAQIESIRKAIEVLEARQAINELMADIQAEHPGTDVHMNYSITSDYLEDSFFLCVFRGAEIISSAGHSRTISDLREQLAVKSAA